VCAAGLGGLTLHQLGGYGSPSGVTLQVLSAREFVVLSAAGARFLDGMDADAPAAAAEWIDGYLARREAWVRREVKALLGLLEQSPPLVTRRWSRFSRLAPDEQHRLLVAWSGHRWSVLRQGYLGLKALLLMGAYRRPETWAAIGYPGPLLERGARG
jgi:hypothetical protein